jgi:hypothetical protein
LVRQINKGSKEATDTRDRVIFLLMNRMGALKYWQQSQIVTCFTYLIKIFVIKIKTLSINIPFNINNNKVERDNNENEHHDSRFLYNLFHWKQYVSSSTRITK